MLTYHTVFNHEVFLYHDKDPSKFLRTHFSYSKHILFSEYDIWQKMNFELVSMDLN